MTEKITREKKNEMRSELEHILLLYREIDELLGELQEKADPQEYRRFWQQLKAQNRELINRTGNYMTQKANR